MSKYKVKRSERTSDLSLQQSKFEVEIYYNGGMVRSYDNVHYPKSFIDKTFNENSNVFKAVVLDLSDNSKYEIKKDGV